MAERSRRRWPRRLLLAAIPLLGFSLWQAKDSVAYVASLRVYSVPSGSMAPTLTSGDRILVGRGSGLPGRGEVWVVSTPNLGTIVKRVVGLPGETIEVAGGRVLIDGRAIPEPYLAKPITYAMPPVRLGREEYFVLGDSRDASNDSHVWGPVARGQFVGRAERRYRPGSGIGGLR